MIFRLLPCRRLRPHLALAAFLSIGVVALAASVPAGAPLPRFDGRRALEYTSEFVSVGPRWVGSEGHAKAEAFLRRQFARDHLEKDTFTASTPVGTKEMTNYIVKFPGKKDGIIVLAGHYETNYPLRNTSYIGANDGGSSTGLLLELANGLRGKPPEGYSVWLVFFDGEEAFQEWSRSDSLYGSKHLAAKWQSDGTLKRIKAFLLADMIGDRDLDVDRDTNSTPWLLDLVYQAASKYGNQSYLFGRQNTIEDDHLPFVERKVPAADIIDIDYGYNDSYHHTTQDTMDKLSAGSLTTVGEIFLETIQLLNRR